MDSALTTQRSYRRVDGRIDAFQIGRCVGIFAFTEKQRVPFNISGGP